MATPSRAGQPIEFEPFRRWVIATYGDRADLIIRQAIEDSFKVGGVEANNEFYQAWVSNGKPGAREAERITAPPEFTAQFPGIPPVQERGILGERTLEVLERFQPKPPIGGVAQILGEPEGGEEPEKDTAGSVVETVENGRRIVRRFDENGNLFDVQDIGPAGDSAQLEQQAGQFAQTFGLQQARFQFEQQQAEQNRINALRAQFGSAAAQRQFLAAQGQRTEADISRGIQAGFAKQFEAFRQQVLGGTAPRGFFQREALRGEVNPFAPDVTTVGDKIGGIEEALKRAEGSLSTVLKRATETTRRAQDPDDPLTISGISNPSTTEEFRASALFEERNQRVQRVDQLREALGRAEDEFETSGEAAFAKPRAIEGGNFAVGAPEEPRIPRSEIQVPRALQEFFPEGIGGRFVTPSAQAINRLGFTGREQLFGGIEFRGEQPLDVLGDIEATLSPRRKGPTFTPFRQE